MRKKPKSLQQMEILRLRMPLSKEQQKVFNDQKIGFAGERIADEMIDPKLSNCIILNDLRLQGNRLCQIDKLIISPTYVYACEIKNYGGTFIFKENRFYNHKMHVRDNPFLQLERTEQQLHSVITNFNMPIKSCLLMVNPLFQLHGSSIEMPLILSSQIERFTDSLANERHRLTGFHYELARYLKESHQEHNPYEQLPAFDYATLKKGIFCHDCAIEMTKVTSKTFLCRLCGTSHTKQQIVARSIAELRILFGNDKISTQLIQDWTGKHINRRSIQRTVRRLEQK